MEEEEITECQSCGSTLQINEGEPYSINHKTEGIILLCKYCFEENPSVH